MLERFRHSTAPGQKAEHGITTRSKCAHQHHHPMECGRSGTRHTDIPLIIERLPPTPRARQAAVRPNRSSSLMRFSSPGQFSPSLYNSLSLSPSHYGSQPNQSRLNLMQGDQTCTNLRLLRFEIYLTFEAEPDGIYFQPLHWYIIESSRRRLLLLLVRSGFRGPSEGSFLPTC